jgi:hypothetical protein
MVFCLFPDVLQITTINHIGKDFEQLSSKRKTHQRETSNSQLHICEDQP